MTTLTKEQLIEKLENMNYTQIALLITDDMTDDYFQAHPQLDVANNKDVVLFAFDNNKFSLPLPKTNETI